MAKGWLGQVRLAPARRKAVTQGFARTAALRLQGRTDPGLPLAPGPAGVTFSP